MSTNSTDFSFPKFVGWTLIGFATVTAFVILAPLGGALAGYVLSITIPHWISGGFAAFGLTVAPEDFYKVGATLAWVGSFFKYANNASSKGAGK